MAKLIGNLQDRLFGTQNTCVQPQLGIQTPMCSPIGGSITCVNLRCAVLVRSMTACGVRPTENRTAMPNRPPKQWSRLRKGFRVKFLKENSFMIFISMLPIALLIEADVVDDIPGIDKLESLNAVHPPPPHTPPPHMCVLSRHCLWHICLCLG